VAALIAYECDYRLISAATQWNPKGCQPVQLPRPVRIRDFIVYEMPSVRQTAAGLLLISEVCFQRTGAGASSVQAARHTRSWSRETTSGGTVRQGEEDGARRAREFIERRIAQRRLTVVQTIGSYRDETRQAVHTDVRTSAWHCSALITLLHCSIPTARSWSPMWCTI